MTKKLKKVNATDALIKVMRLVIERFSSGDFDEGEYDIMMLGLLEALEIVRGE